MFGGPTLILKIEVLEVLCTFQSVKTALAVTPLHPWIWPAKPWQRFHIKYEDVSGVVDAHS